MLITERMFVLKKSLYGEADLIVTLLRSNGSKISAFARAALKSRKRFGGGVLEPTHYISATVSKANPSSDSLHQLREADLVQDFAGLRQNYDRLQSAINITEIVNRVSREGLVEDGAQLFNLYGNTLRALAEAKDPGAYWSLFLAKFLAGQGVLPIDADAQSVLVYPVSQAEEEKICEVMRRIRSQLERRTEEYLSGMAGV